MRGSVIKRGSTWTYVLSLGRDPVTGRRQRKWVGGFRTKSACEGALVEALGRLRRGEYVDPRGLTVGAYLAQWLESMAPSLRPSTMKSYSDIVRLHVAPRIGEVKLARLKPVEISGLYSELLKSGRRLPPAGGLSPTSVLYVHRVLKHALGDAVRWGYLPRNAADLVKAPRVEHSEMTVWGPEDVRRFFDAVADDRLFAMWVLMVTTGMRRGEVVGLRWKDVDLGARRVSIVQTLVDVGYEVYVSAPKTKKGRRAVALDVHTARVMAERRSCQRAEREFIGFDRPAEYVFTKIDGATLQPQNVSQAFETIVRKAGLPRVRLHDLRHTHATLALAAGVHPKIVGERLGHSNIQITLDTYSHVLAGLQDEAAEKVAELIIGGPDSGDTPDSTAALSAPDEALEGPLAADAEGVADVGPGRAAVLGGGDVVGGELAERPGEVVGEAGEAQEGARVIPLRRVSGGRERPQ